MSFGGEEDNGADVKTPATEAGKRGPEPSNPDGSDGRHRDDALVDAFVTASRALVAVAARSLAELDEDVTLPQFRALVVLYTRGAQRSAEVAAILGVNPSTASRMVDRLVRKDLVQRGRSPGDRRALQLELTGGGRQVVVDVTARRRVEIERILGQMPEAGRHAVTRSLLAFADAAGESPEPGWALGWASDDAVRD